MGLMCKGVCLLLGLALIVLGATVKWAIFPSLLHSMILSQLDLSPGTDAYEAWAGQPPIDVLMKFTLLNVTNPEGVKRGEKPIVVDVGPFTYKEIRRKEHVVTVNEHISYGSYIAYEFQPDLSYGSDTTELTIINPVLAGFPALINLLGGLPPELDPLLEQDLFLGCGGIFDCMNYAVNGLWDCSKTEYVDCSAWSNSTESLKDDVFIKVSPREIVFDGFSPGILKFALLLYDYGNFMLSSGGLEDILAELGMNVTLPDSLPPLPAEIAGGTFALFTNGSLLNGWAKIDSGKYVLEKFNSYVEYNGMTRLPDSWWPDFGPTPSAHKSGIKGICKDIVGTDGSMYPPFMNKNDDLWLFNSDLCRSIWLSFEDEVDMQGITTYQFSVPGDVLNMSNPDNFCFCPGVENCAVEVEGEDRWDMSACTHCKDGMLNIMGCRGAPVVMSTPHFLDGDASLSGDIDGMNPDPTLHKTYLNIEPHIGVPIEAHKRIQANIPLYSWDKLDVLKNVREVVFPLLWVDEGFNLDDGTAGDVKGLLVTPILAVDVSMYIAIALGGIIIVGVLLSTCMCNKKKKNYVDKK